LVGYYVTFIRRRVITSSVIPTHAREGGWWKEMNDERWKKGKRPV